jgi:hypothetical protein
LRYAKDACKSQAHCSSSGMEIFGIARISTDGQPLDAQVAALKAARAGPRPAAAKAISRAALICARFKNLLQKPRLHPEEV